MSELAKQIETVVEAQKQNNQALSKQLEFLKQAQRAGVVKKPEYNLASKVYLQRAATL
ncbi:hypothetical protein QWY20_00680 [Alkalimonas sp. MEB108]|uniref:Uncharacterized protein n=1 Tax=Alkalimonas cellulosilytica TaxID=3058395 RepID=A0ABU7J0D1_9GAMM|nr:hypothetical protein [Alkalimonas sp. MEB108]MEE1999954.1 hypothetical protein [Alkalimonas sp. MEB108]